MSTVLSHSPVCLLLPDFLPQRVNHDQFPLLIGVVPVLPTVAGGQITHHRPDFMDRAAFPIGCPQRSIRQDNCRFTGLPVEIETLPRL